MPIGKFEKRDEFRVLEQGSAGVKADGEMEGSSFNPLGNPGVEHWKSSYISKPGFEDRGNIFFAAVEMTRMPMVVTDPRQPDNPIVFTNGAFLDLTGYTQEQVIGRNCRFLQGPDTDQETVAEIRLAVQEQRAVAVDILNYKADGRPFWNGLFLGPVFDQDGELLYFFASQIDITQRLSSQQLYAQAQKMEAIGQLTAGLAHDFNNLLQVAIGNQEMASRQCDLPDLARTALRKSQMALEKASKLTQQLLAFARKQNLSPRRINLNVVIAEFSDMLHVTLGSKIDIRLDLKPGLPSCELDPEQLEMALLNILINARDAMPNGGRVTIGTGVLSDADRLKHQRLMAGSYLTLSVADEGIGMAPDVARRATEPFFTTKGPGTGLGLAMVHGFVEQSRGRLEIDSELGKGTTIRMLFPVAEGDGTGARDGRAQGQAGTRLDGQAGGGRQQTVLVVDDNDDVRGVAEMFLASLGYAVLSASSGEQALQVLKSGGPVALLFTDVIMPGGMNGLQLIQQVQAQYPGIAVLAATGYMDDLPDRAAVKGPLDILAKPFKLSELAEKVQYLTR